MRVEFKYSSKPPGIFIAKQLYHDKFDFYSGLSHMLLTTLSIMTSITLAHPRVTTLQRPGHQTAGWSPSKLGCPPYAALIVDTQTTDKLTELQLLGTSN